ncbi:uncharacterized protein LOC113350913 [Papaver somniferum]|uniref:uncharacterized protein LOC113350913 n=1 Tax=Papaver somniferum TaxID=3469 RepID=UPI000E7044BE|nr:uncharacterized protein LOC113350913 [Papaver somniferum]
MVTGIHGANLALDRRELWQELELMSTYNLPWLVIGDFNMILSVDEKKGGRSPIKTSMLEFNHCLQSCGLINAPKSGLSFSWCNNRAGVKRILCNLDRVVYNDKWMEIYPNWEYKVGTRGASDHSPLCGAHNSIPKPQNAPFRALKVGLTHKYFLKIVSDEWNKEISGTPIFIFMHKFKNLKTILKKWNWDVFGDVNAKLIQADKDVLQETLASDNNPEDIKLLNNLVTARGVQEILTSQYNAILSQKARTKWLKEGAANTNFFHTTMKIR